MKKAQGAAHEAVAHIQPAPLWQRVDEQVAQRQAVVAAERWNEKIKDKT